MNYIKLYPSYVVYTNVYQGDDLVRSKHVQHYNTYTLSSLDWYLRNY